MIAMSETNDGKIAAFLTDNPRMIGVLFTMTLLLAQTGAVSASNVAIAGP